MRDGHAVHVDLDGAWPDLPLPRIDALAWGPQLRFSAPRRLITAFRDELLPQLTPFVLFGSGDFHHLSGVWIQRFARPFTLVSFDNHPDWDIRPPAWGCGSWINRALDLPQVRLATVWGCGNFECWWPGQLWGNRRAERSGRLQVHPWAEDRPPKDHARRGAVLPPNWQEKFQEFVGSITGTDVYVTIDLDCLKREFACTNWENGRFSLDDIVWALTELRRVTKFIGGDLCGAYSPAKYARRKQRFASETDHPKMDLPEEAEARMTNRAAFDRLWPALAQ